MPYGGNDWLALTQEPTLEPEIPICDPHHHFWDFRSERVPYQRYLLHELMADIAAVIMSARRYSSKPARCTDRMDPPSCARLARSSSSRAWPQPAPAASMAHPGRQRQSLATPI